MDFRRGREKNGSRQMIEARSEMKDVDAGRKVVSCRTFPVSFPLTSIPAAELVRHLQSTVKTSDRVSAPPIRLGDTVVFFEGREAIGFDRMKPKTIWQCRHGAFHHDDIIGKPFGCRVFSRTTMGHVYALSPTPELWCQVVPSRTQIVQDFDQSIVIFRLDIKPGDVVVESGTGSGVMSTAIMRTIAPTGFLYTFEFNEIRAKNAQEEFNGNELGSLSKVIHRDVCAERDQGGGFGHELDGKADAVFLDLPEPWLAVPHAKLVLKSGKKIASYSPCIEQVMKTCEALRSEGFHSVTTIECRLRPINYIDVQLDTPDFGAQQKQATTTPSAASSETSSGQLKDEACGGVERGSCNEGIENSDAPAAEGDSNGHHKAGVTASQGVTVDQGVTTVTDSKKRARDQLVSGTDQDTVECGIGRGRSERLPSKSAIRAAELAATRGAEPRTPRKLVCAQPFPVMRGHTAFLTFATTPVARRTLSTGAAAADRQRSSGDKADTEESKGEEGGHAKAANSSTMEARLVIHTKGQGDGGDSKDEDEDRHETNPTGSEERRHSSTDTSRTLGGIEPTSIPGPTD